MRSDPLRSLSMSAVIVCLFCSLAQAQNLNEIQKLLASDGAANDLFGYSASISGDYAVVGAFYDDDNGGRSGSAYVFERNAVGTWGQVARLLPTDGASLDNFGVAVSISGDYAVVGAYADDDNGLSSGSAYVFELPSSGSAVAERGTKRFALSQNTPNPFNPSTTIRFDLPVASAVRLAIYSTSGQLARTLVDSRIDAGTHQVVWDGLDALRSEVSSGVYLYRLTSAEGTLVRRMLLVR
jgi:hypothetical protein